MSDGSAGAVAVMAKDEALARRKAFGDELGRVLAVRRMTQQDLATALGVKQPTVSGWISALNEPESATVFRAEEVLELPPGHLSRLLGYLPPSAVNAPNSSFEELVTTDPLLDETQKRMILALYREATSRKGTTRGRPKKS